SPSGRRSCACAPAARGWCCCRPRRPKTPRLSTTRCWATLILAGFPEDRIAIFNADQAPNPARRQLLAERFNGVPPVLDENGQVEQEGIPPQYDLVIANATAYEGIDLHVRTCQVYHIDLPWEPATLQQRNGRAVRQGNLQAVIRIYYL